MKKAAKDILIKARAVRAQVKRELTDLEIDQYKREGRLLDTGRRFRSSLTFETTAEEISKAKRQGRR
jgi:multidrug efflux pump subunit AcrA (membrane-fusion protein)